MNGGETKGVKKQNLKVKKDNQKIKGNQKWVTLHVERDRTTLNRGKAKTGNRRL